MSVHTETPQVWIACLASYNAGRLVGEWVDATDIDNFNEAVERIKVEAVKAARAEGESALYFPVPEEFAIHDYNNFPRSLVSQFGEYPNWKHVVQAATAIEEQGDMFLAWLEFRDSIDFDEEDIVERCQEQFCGNADNEESYAEEYVSMCGGWAGVPTQMDNPAYPFHSHEKYINPWEELTNYIDWESIAQELFDHGTMSLVTVNGTGYVFGSER